MLQIFGPKGTRTLTTHEAWPAPEEIGWIDCVNPTREEELRVEALLEMELPTLEEMREIEISNRLYEEQTGGGTVVTMTATLVGRSDDLVPEAGPVTFLLAPRHLVTLRYNDYKSFTNFAHDFEKHPYHFVSADQIFTGLMGSIVERLADILEKVGAQAEELSGELFALKLNHKKAGHKAIKPRELLNRVGAVGNLDAKVRESLVSLQRLNHFINDKRASRFTDEARAEVQALRHDIQALSEHSSFLSDKITFLLDATLGLINIEQNDIIRIFSIAAVTFMPPTLIASIYGMNFEIMPELKWEMGYEYALLLMLCSTLIPFWYFRKRGWV